MFYKALMEKKAEGNYYSRHLDDDMRLESLILRSRRIDRMRRPRY